MSLLERLSKPLIRALGRQETLVLPELEQDAVARLACDQYLKSPTVVKRGLMDQRSPLFSPAELRVVDNGLVNEWNGKVPAGLSSEKILAAAANLESPRLLAGIPSSEHGLRFSLPSGDFTHASINTVSRGRSLSVLLSNAEGTLELDATHPEVKKRLAGVLSTASRSQNASIAIEAFRLLKVIGPLN